MTEFPPQEIECIALAVEHETSGKQKHGAVEVAQVVINRSKDPNYPNSPCKVVFQPKQFSNIRPKPISDASRKATATALESYKEGTANVDIIAFHSLPKTPKSWKKLELVFRIGSHSFYKFK